jgi:hypothetical protein
MRRRLPLLAGLALVGLLAGCGSGTSTPSATDGHATSEARLAAGEPPPTGVAVGDIACAPGKRTTRTTCRQAKTARAALALGPTRVLALGDLQYERGRYRAFKRSYAKSWGALRSITWPVPGNHEYETSGARGYYRYFAAQQPGAPGYYRRQLGDWQLYLLNSNCSKVDCIAERDWLAQEMDAHPSTCSLIAFHYPRFSSGEHGSTRGMRKFWRVADARGADVALSGHDHDYERFLPMDASGQADPDGIRQFVSGGGGRSLYPRQSSAPGSQVFLARFGVLELTLRSDSYSWRFLTPRLRVRDSGSAACR